MQAFIISLIILGFFAFVYQGIALSSREVAVEERASQVTIQKR
ncbi:MAG TPA: hypothetical protein VGW35_09225 [Methylomirabilota bacterium]|nr:hypothetical protein [Methylomirabilota bacterium]HEV8676896.1 hypothetical protein [Methylomirabilota bacterium]